MAERTLLEVLLVVVVFTDCVRPDVDYGQWGRLRDALGVDRYQGDLSKVKVTASSVNTTHILLKIATDVAHDLQLVYQAVEKIHNRTVELLKNNGFSDPQPPVDECCKLTGTLVDSSFFPGIQVTKKPCIKRAPDAPSDAMVPINANLSSVMSDNFDLNFNSLTHFKIEWQYFATEQGILGKYPGNWGNNCTNFDNRERPWYRESLSPVYKDLVIAIDVSTYMSSAQLKIAKQLARTVLASSGPNDRVTILRFNDKTSLPNDDGNSMCFGTMLGYATPDVVQHLNSFIDSITGSTRDSNYYIAVTGACQLLSTIQKDAGRQKAILFISHNSTSLSSNSEFLSDLKQQLTVNNDTLLFSYEIGAGITNQILKSMSDISQQLANSNLSFFATVENSSVVQSRLTNFYKYLAPTQPISVPIVSTPFMDINGIGNSLAVCLPVYQPTDTFRGVTCVQLAVSSIATDTFLRDDNDAYVFLFDSTGRTLLHPRFPAPGTASDASPIYIDISYLESMAIAQRVKNSSDPVQMFKVNISSLAPRGNSSLYGVNEDVQTFTYTYMKVVGTDFTVCLVTPEASEMNYTMNTDGLDPGTLEIVYHDLPLNDKIPPTCLQDADIVVKDNSSVFFTPKAILHEGTVTDYKNCIRVPSSTFNQYFLPSVRTQVQLTHVLASIWNSTPLDMKSAIPVRFIGTRSGVFRSVPGHRMYPDYDHTMENWYLKAKAYPDQIVAVRSRATNEFNFTDGIILAKAVTVSEVKIFFGVLGMFLKTEVFQSFTGSFLSTCNDLKHECVLVDEGGLILTTTNSEYLSKSSIADLDTDSASLLTKQATGQWCTDYAFRQAYHTWHVPNSTVGQQRKDTSLFPVLNTNMFLILYFSPPQTSSNCKSIGGHLLESCSDVSCMSPCNTSTRNYILCTNSFTDSNTAVFPCVKPNDIQRTFLKDGLNPASKPQCYDITCANLQAEWLCRLHDQCSWCHSGSIFPEYRCFNALNCNSASSPKTAGLIVGVIVGLLAMAFIAAGAAFCIKKKYTCSYFIVETPYSTEDSGGHYDTIMDHSRNTAVSDSPQTAARSSDQRIHSKSCDNQYLTVGALCPGIKTGFSPQYDNGRLPAPSLPVESPDCFEQAREQVSNHDIPYLTYITLPHQTSTYTESQADGVRDQYEHDTNYKTQPGFKAAGENDGNTVYPYSQTEGNTVYPYSQTEGNTVCPNSDTIRPINDTVLSHGPIPQSGADVLMSVSDTVLPAGTLVPSDDHIDHYDTHTELSDCVTELVGGGEELADGDSKLASADKELAGGDTELAGGTVILLRDVGGAEILPTEHN